MCAMRNVASVYCRLRVSADVLQERRHRVSGVADDQEGMRGISNKWTYEFPLDEESVTRSQLRTSEPLDSTYLPPTGQSRD